jgi:glutamate/tyrosine decarboxylase-like PLP-dependent enzyme
MVERHCAMASELAAWLRDGGFNVLNRVVLNQIVVRGRTDEETTRIRSMVEKSGEAWFGPTVWKGETAFRISISSWRTTQADIGRLFAAIVRARDGTENI